MLTHTPEQAKAMMGVLWGQPLLSTAQVVNVVLDVVKSHHQKQQAAATAAGAAATAAAAAAEVAKRRLQEGVGCVHLLLQNGRVVDPFAPRPKQPRQQQQQQGGGLVGVPAAAASSAAASAGEASLARFPPAALNAYAMQPPPGSYRKIQVVKLSTDFAAATRLVTVPLQLWQQGLASGSVLVRRLFTGINASDINYTSGRYVSVVWMALVLLCRF